MPAIAAAPLFWGAVVGAGATAASSVYGANKQSNSARDAANAQVTAANKAAELQSKSAAEALAFQREQAARDQQNYVGTQLANYEQDTARQQRIGSLGELLGLPSRNIPPPPSYLTSQQTTPNSGQMPGGADSKLTAAIAAYQQANPGNVAIEPLTAALKAQGFNVSRYDYGEKGGLSNNELNVNGQKYKVLGGEGTPAAYWYKPGMNDSPGGSSSRSMAPAVMPMSAYFAPQRSPLTPALTLPGANPFGVN